MAMVMSNAAVPALKVCDWEHPLYSKSMSLTFKAHLATELNRLSLSCPRRVVVREALKDAPILDKTSEEGNVEAQAATGMEGEGNDEDEEFEKGFSMKKVCDKLIEVFTVEKPEPEEWRKLLGFSQDWKRLRPHFYRQCQLRAETEEDPRKMENLYNLYKKLKQIDEEMMRHDELLEEIEQNETELDVVVAKRRKDFTGDFFKHIRVLCRASSANLNRREKLVEFATRCLATVEEYDKLIEDKFALEAARQKFEDILNSPSLEEASKMIDKLSKKKQFDPTLMLVISKAWASAKESSTLQEEVKDIMSHLYRVAKANMQKQVPKEVRILKQLMAIEDPRDRLGALAKAFSPGDKLDVKHVDLLYTTPNKLYRQVMIIVDLYYNNKENTAIEEAQKLMDPMVISRLEVLRDIIKQEFL